MAKCPKCNATVAVKISDLVECPTCNNRLVGTFSSLGKLLLLFIILFEYVASITIAVIAGSINYPFFPKWLIAGSLLLGMIIVTPFLLYFIANKLVLFRLK